MHVTTPSSPPTRIFARRYGGVARRNPVSLLVLVLVPVVFVVVAAGLIDDSANEHRQRQAPFEARAARTVPTLIRARRGVSSVRHGSVAAFACEDRSHARRGTRRPRPARGSRGRDHDADLVA